MVLTKEAHMSGLLSFVFYYIIYDIIIIILKYSKGEFMAYESILMKELKVLNSKVIFGEALFSSHYFQHLDTRLFETFDDKVVAIKVIVLSLCSLLLHKRQQDCIEMFWKYLDSERKKDHRINKGCLKKTVKNSFYLYHERKSKKLTVIESRSNYSLKYLELLTKQLSELKYKMTQEDYIFCRDSLFLCVKMIFRTVSEFGYGPVIKHNNITALERFYTYYPELISINISQSDSCEEYFELILRIWNLTKDEKYLKDLDVAFERLKSSNGRGYGLDVERELDAIAKNPKYSIQLPHFEKFKQTKNYIQFKERNIIQWDIEISVLQKWGLSLRDVSLSPAKLFAALEWLKSFEINDLELLKPLNNIYMDLSKTHICFIFNKDLIDNDESFEKYWLKIVDEIIFEQDEENKILIVETINKEYLLDLEIPSAQGKKDILRKF